MITLDWPPFAYTSLIWPFIYRFCFHDYRIYISSQQLFLSNASLYSRFGRRVLF